MHNFDEFYDIKGTNFKVINCKNCGFWHVFPYPSQEQMDTFYEKKYQDKLNKHNLIEKTDLLKNKNVKTVLDIGCGDGELLDVFKKMVLKLMG